ncbi:O-antigen polymerase [Oceanirhabdus seepicola]|uniref:Oligosaccharide repeat unit polymerase n=1 Tax=Oceanirhabdus seepicola TaxID=2828781 RepID=A0A9J6P7A6_9CLOT|nr:O-antigen polymerase [Oceanirhabdus seepicola]MCM1992499.1 oligosaccharide repeat unit polymerase [Oceanirhabdus seepicola]
MSIKILIILVVFSISTYLFRKASGTLALNKLNIVSYIYYLFMITAFIGGSLIFLGFREHYLIKSMMINDSTINITFMFIMYCAIMLPLTMVIFFRIFKANSKKEYNNYLKKDIIIEYEREAFLLISLASILCILLSVYMFIKMGRVPLVDLVFNRGADTGTLRHEITSTLYLNPYIKNLFILTLTPLLSYFTFIYANITRDKKWIMLFALLFVTSIFVKTYDYSKSPVVFYMVIFIFIHILIYGKISNKLLIPCGIGCVGVILFMYARSGFNMENLFDIYNGPIGRTIFTSIGTLFLHFDLFPTFLPFLGGRSLSPTVMSLLTENMTHIRSGRVVMEFYSPFRVHAGTAGVMNSNFMGEAYANFGYSGALLAPIYVGILLALAYFVFLRMKKKPDNIMIYIALVVFFSTTLNGGFSDYVYNFNIIFIIIGLIVFKFLVRTLNRFTNKEN